MALSKAVIEQVLQARLSIREFGEKFLNGYAGFFFLLFHAPNVPQTLPYVKGINPSFFSGKPYNRLYLVIITYIHLPAACYPRVAGKGPTAIRWGAHAPRV